LPAGRHISAIRIAETLVPDAFSLDPLLARDTVAIGELTVSLVLAMNDANYPWLILVPRHAGAVEIIDLDFEQRSELMNEIALVARVLKDVTACDKLNIAAIGNVVPQLHIHVVARRQGDAAWPRPVWGAVPPQLYEPAALQRFIESIRSEIAFG
jgi:diadenosine tetraphosphate (Ap4A) HIT family hydrolase